MLLHPDQPFAGDEVIASGLSRTLRALLKGTTHLVALIEIDGTIAYTSPAVLRLLGRAPQSVIGSNVLDLLHPDDQGMAMSMLAYAGSRADETGVEGDDDDVGGEYRLHHADGSWVPFEVLRSDFTSDPAIGALLVIGREVVGRRALDDALTALAHDEEGTDALRKLTAYLDGRIPGTMSAWLLSGETGDWVTEKVPDQLLVGAGPWLSAMATKAAVLADLSDGATEIDDALRAEMASLDLKGCWCIPLPVGRPQIYSPGAPAGPGPSALGCLVVWSALYDQPLMGHLGVIERVGGLADVALRRQMTTRELRDLVVRDHVTGALTRAGFDRLSTDGGTDQAIFAVIDLDDFKVVNDSHGHPMGDQVLRFTAQRIQSLLRPGDILGRLGGDEFVLRLQGTDLAAAKSVADRIIAAVERPLSDGGVSVHVKASIGIAPFAPELSYRDLIARADAAMYSAKRRGKGHWEVWEERPPPP